jgi:hypothetical protein
VDWGRLSRVDIAETGGNVNPGFHAQRVALLQTRFSMQLVARVVPNPALELTASVTSTSLRRDQK